MRRLGFSAWFATVFGRSGPPGALMGPSRGLGLPGGARTARRSASRLRGVKRSTGSPVSSPRAPRNREPRGRGTSDRSGRGPRGRRRVAPIGATVASPLSAPARRDARRAAWLRCAAGGRAASRRPRSLANTARETRPIAVRRKKTSAASSEKADRKRARLLEQVRRRFDERAARAPRRRGGEGR